MLDNDFLAGGLLIRTNLLLHFDFIYARIHYISLFGVVNLMIFAI